MMPKGLKLDATFTSLTVGNNIEDRCGIEHFTDAFEGRSSALAHWLTDSNTVFALLLSPDGTIRARNRAATWSSLLIRRRIRVRPSGTTWSVPTRKTYASGCWIRKSSRKAPSG
jgi:hypothetical protein